MRSDEDRDLPYGIKGLAWAGVLPLVLVAAALIVQPDTTWRPRLVAIAIGYGAVVLAFLGAVHWGLVLARGHERAPRILAIGVLRALLGAVAVNLPPEPALAVLVAGFGLWWLYEYRRLGPVFLSPAWLKMRRELTLVVCSALALVLVSGA